MESSEQKKTKSVVVKKVPAQTSNQKKNKVDESAKATTSQGNSSQSDDKKRVHFSPSVESTPVQVKKKSEQSPNKAAPKGTLNKEDRKRATAGDIQAKKPKHDVELSRVLNMEKEIRELSADLIRLSFSTENIIHASANIVTDIVSCSLEKFEFLRIMSLKLDEVDDNTQRSLNAINLDDVENEVGSCLLALEKYLQLESQFARDFELSSDSHMDDILCYLEVIERERNLLQGICA